MNEINKTILTIINSYTNICHQLFSYKCLLNYSDYLYEIMIYQRNISSCLSIDNNNNNFTKYIIKDKYQYFVFYYLNNTYKNIDDIIKNNFLPFENIVLLKIRIFSPYKYNRTELILVAIQISNNNIIILNNALQMFYTNQSLIIDLFARQICIDYQQAFYFNKYYRFNKTILWIIRIIGSFLMNAFPLIKTKIYLKNKEKDISIKSIRTTSKIHYRKRNDSGYESNEDTDDYLEQIITNYQQEEFHVYPILNESRHRNTTTIDDLFSLNNTSSTRSTNSYNIPRHYIQRSASMSTQKTHHQSSINSNQTLKPLIQQHSTLFDSNIGTLIRLTGTPTLNNEHDTYISTKFSNENTSKFIIGTLWNTFALVNNLFLQRPIKCRNTLTNQSNIQPDQLTHLQELYSLAEHDQTNNLQSIITKTLLEPETTEINHLQSIIFDILSSSKDQHCTCYKNHHISSCIYYDHSLPYIKHFIDNTLELEKIFNNIQKSNQIHQQNATTQSYIEKPKRNFTHFKQTNNIATQSNPIENKYNNLNYIDVSTQTIENNKNNLNHISTQIYSKEIKNNINMNIINQLKTNINNQSTEIEDISTRKSNLKIIENKTIYDQRNSLMNQLKQVLSSSPILKKQIINEDISEKKPCPTHTVRSLVSMFETTLPISAINKSNIPLFRHKSLINDSKVLTPTNSTLLNIGSEQTHSTIVHHTIEQYANEIASNIVDNAVLTAITTTVYHDEQEQQQLQRRFSFYNNGGGHGKSLLFQSNTFVPVNQEIDQHFQAESHESSPLLNEPLPSTIPINLENQSQQTLIIDRYIDGENSNQSKTKKHHSLTLNTKFDSSSSSSSDEQIIHRQYLSHSQLFSAQELYIRPWLVRQATAPDIHCLDNNINNTHIQTLNIFFNIFPSNIKLDLYTRYTCLITILFYLYDIHDEYSNQILYDELDQIKKQLISSIIHSNRFQTINSHRINKRYQTGIIFDINKLKIHAKQIEWKHVKIVLRRFRKKYQHYKQLMKYDKKENNYQLNINNYFKYFDSTSKRRIKKYAKHYAEKL